MAGVRQIGRTVLMLEWVLTIKQLNIDSDLGSYETLGLNGPLKNKMRNQFCWSKKLAKFSIFDVAI